MTILSKKITNFALAALCIAGVTIVLGPITHQVNSTTVALALLVVVLFSATLWGSGPAVLASVLGMLSFNFFFLPPLHTWTIEDPHNWVALAAFLITALTAGQLSARAKKRAEEAETGRQEIRRLYEELQTAFERASHAEALKQSERLKSALLDAVTHDIRTPLTAIKASVTTLLETNRSAEDEEMMVLDAASRLEMLEVIDEESDRLNRFVEDLVELAKIEAGDLQLRLRWGAMDEIIATALARAKPLTRKHLIEIKIDNGLPVVCVDPKAVSEVIYNLIDNATKFSPAGCRITVTAQPAGNEQLRLTIQDEGPGIPPELRERVFDKFFRATRNGDASVMRSPGTGMGLSIAKGIVEAHGGQIWVEDATNTTGTKFVVTLPIGEDKQISKILEVNQAQGMQVK
ncbi:MAG TPA: ATP-binding protein [Pyrinomonadaceae bacterium]|nr:ATP-binding protein [Pyrinomonadaceae bacterium]